MGLVHDAISIIGFSMIFVGCWWLSPAVALIAGGLILFAGAIHAAWLSGKTKRQDSEDDTR